jgi:hypothetical protein
MTTITYFDVKNTDLKYPQSNFEDFSFIFKNVIVDSNLQAFQFLVNHFILNIPLNIKNPIKTYRKKKELEPFSVQTFEYILLDFDITSKNNLNSIIEYFKDFKCIIGESRSFNGVDNFNIKGILFIESCNLKEAKQIQAKIQFDLKNSGYYNEDVLRYSYFTAAINKSEILFNNESGKKYPKSNIKIYELTESPDIQFKLVSKNTIDMCQETFKNLGYIAYEFGDTFIKYEFNGDQNYIWYYDNPYIMNHKNRLNSLNIWNFIKKQFFQNYDISSIFSDYEGLEVDTMDFSGNEHKELIEKFLFKKSGVLTLKSFMGSGKTLLIKKIIEKSFDSDLRVLIITNRRSIAFDYHTKFNIKLYSDFNYEIGDSLICQYDSLFKYDINNFDVVIIDEFVSLMNHSVDNLTNKLNNLEFVYKSFQKRLIIADAFLNSYSINLIQNPNKLNIINVKKDSADLFEAPDSNTFFYYLSAISSKSKCSVSVTALKTLEVIEKFLKSQGLRVITITAKTPNLLRDFYLSLLELPEQDYFDVLLYSPTITVGISNMNLIDYHFHYDCGNSVDPIQSVQMLRRSRKVSKIIYYVKCTKRYDPIDYDSIRNSYIDAKYPILTKTNNYGEVEISEIGKFKIKNEIFKNLLFVNYKKSFDYFVKSNFEKTPIMLESKPFQFISKSVKETNFIESLSNLECDLIYNLTDLTIANDLDLIKEILKYDLKILRNLKLLCEIHTKADFNRYHNDFIKSGNKDLVLTNLFVKIESIFKNAYNDEIFEFDKMINLVELASNKKYSKIDFLSDILNRIKISFVF